MCNGKTHAVASVVTAVGTGTLLYCNNIASLLTSCQVAAGALLGVLISPDLDLMENGNYSMVILRQYSPVLAKAWRCMWWPYAKLCHHRGVSHWPIIGTLLRTVYIFFPILVIVVLLNWVCLESPITIHLEFFIPYFFGLALADLVHSILDVVF